MSENPKTNENVQSYINDTMGDVSFIIDRSATQTGNAGNLAHVFTGFLSVFLRGKEISGRPGMLTDTDGFAVMELLALAKGVVAPSPLAVHAQNAASAAVLRAAYISRAQDRNTAASEPVEEAPLHFPHETLQAAEAPSPADMLAHEKRARLLKLKAELEAQLASLDNEMGIAAGDHAIEHRGRRKDPINHAVRDGWLTPLEEGRGSHSEPGPQAYRTINRAGEGRIRPVPSPVEEENKQEFRRTTPPVFA